MHMNKRTITERIALMCQLSRGMSGLSQYALAKKIGVSRRTIENWESGEASPSLEKMIEWFDATGQPMYPYMLELLHPTVSYNSIDEEETRQAISSIIDELSIDQCRKLLFLLCGGHGSNPEGVEEMITAYLNTPLSMRLNIANSIITNYSICQVQGLLRGDVQPDFEKLKHCYQLGWDAVMLLKNAYGVEIE